MPVESGKQSVADEIWAIVAPLIPETPARPQGGGMRRVDDRTVFTAIVFVLVNGCAWHDLPASYGVTVPTAHRRFTEWTRADLWSQVYEAAIAGPATQEMISWSRSLRHLAMARATRRLTTASP
jgi:transposase